MKYVFISQPMKNKNYAQIFEERGPVIRKMMEEGYYTLGSVFDFKDPAPAYAQNQRVYYLAKAIDILCRADKAYFMKGWEKADGCIIEHEICKRYGIPIEYAGMMK